MQRRTRQRRTTRALIQKIGVTLTLALLLAVFSDSLQVNSRSISSGAPEQLAITGGVLTIAPGGVGDAVMELGNNGNEIISTDWINIRPNVSAVGTKFVGNADKTQDLLLTGKFDVQGTITLGGIPRSTWPYLDHWKVTQTEQGASMLTPSESNMNLSTGSQQTAHPEVAGLSLYSNDSTHSALNVTNNGNTTVDFNNSNLSVYGDFKANGNIYVCSSATAADCHTTGSLYKVLWNKINMANFGGIDADTLDDVDTYFVGTCNGVPNAICLCTTMPASTSRCKILTTPVHDVP